MKMKHVLIGALVATWGKGRLSIEGFMQGIITSVIPLGPLIFDRHLKQAAEQRD